MCTQASAELFISTSLIFLIFSGLFYRQKELPTMLLSMLCFLLYFGTGVAMKSGILEQTVATENRVSNGSL